MAGQMVVRNSNVMVVLLAALLGMGCPGGAASEHGIGAPGEVGGTKTARSPAWPGAQPHVSEARPYRGRSRPGAREVTGQVYFLDSQSRTFHGRSCPLLRGRTGIRQVRTMVQALDAGYRPCPVCRPARAYLVRLLGPLPKPPVAQPGQERACHGDGDCVLLPLPPCACPPCGWTWRRAVNRKHAKWLVAEWAKESCPPMPCRQCADPVVRRLGPLLGSRAVCRRGVCQVAE